MIYTQTNNNFPNATIHPGAKVDNSVQIGPFTYIDEDVEIGAGTIIGPNVSIHKGVRIGENCYISPNTVIKGEYSQLQFWKSEIPHLNGKNLLARIGNNVHIESSVTIHGEIVIEDGCWIGSNATIHDGARIGKNCKIFPSAVISAIPQDLKFKGERTTLEVGENTVIRECATLNRGTEFHGKTQIGKNCLIMAYVHVAHDCIIGNNVIISNSVNIAGHVEIGDHVVVGGVSAFHQFTKVGNHAFIAGGSLVRKDVPPYVKAGREPVQFVGVNSIGLRRRGFQPESIHQIQEIYRQVFLAGLNTGNAIEYIETHLPATEERDEVIAFIRKADRGIIKGQTNGSDKVEETKA